MRIYVLFLVRYSILREYPLKVGVDCDEVPPVPIPNTVVKLIYVENTWRVTAREDRCRHKEESTVPVLSLYIPP